MGGSAFSAVLTASALPRMPPAVYRAVKARLAPRLESLYAVVSTPYEAPEKDDHGDLDFLVCEPRTTEIEVPYETVQAVLNAKHVVPMPGNRTSSYAVPVEIGEWGAFGHASDETTRREVAKTDDQHELYYQVDVHVCSDRAEWERIQFFHGYGDLGMIIGLVARNKGLALGSKGLKVPHPPRPPFDLSDSMDEIVKYMGLSMERWKAGFQTKQQVFEWVATSSLFDPARFQTEGQGIKKVKPERKMYAQFVEWVKEQQRHSTPSPGALDKEGQIQHALDYFGKKDEFDTLEREDADKARLKQGFSGIKVREWTGLRGEQWKELKATMDLVRSWVGGEPGILKILDEEGEAVLKQIVLRALAEQDVAEITNTLQGVVVADP
ncbi:hypothetical protein C8R43DRAFT_979893 [Mycena crocata]|nr:hypothetical protein C8R43DRAFT_979893 [Mycena crocata]